jgi:MYXO-CTERM domain-containing protein
MKRLLVIGVAALGLALAGTAEASTPHGAWAHVDKVELLPDEAGATKVVLTGKFALTQGPGKGVWAYENPVAGYMYFQCPSGSEADCRLQWSEIKGTVGTTTCAGFGQSDVVPGTVRPAGTPLGTPDNYFVGMGVTRTVYAGGVCEKLRTYSVDAGVTPAPDAGNPGTPPAPVPTTPAPKTESPGGGGTTSSGCALGGSSTSSGALAVMVGLILVGLRRRR